MIHVICLDKLLKMCKFHDYHLHEWAEKKKASTELFAKNYQFAIIYFQSRSIWKKNSQTRDCHPKYTITVEDYYTS